MNSPTFFCWGRGMRAKASRKSLPMATVRAGMGVSLLEEINNLSDGDAVFADDDNLPASFLEQWCGLRLLRQEQGHLLRRPRQFRLGTDAALLVLKFVAVV